MTSPQQPTTAHHLTVETGGDAFPVSTSTPALSWQLPHGTSTQLSADLEARCGDEILSASFEGSGHRFIAWPWRQLSSREPVRWRVRSQPDGFAGEWSDWSTFEAGLFESDWTAEWISAPEEKVHELGERPAVVFSKTFHVDRVPGDARLYSTALGVYETFINGKRVGSAELAPGSQSYDRTLYAQAADPTPLLTIGANTIEIILSDGWYRGRAGAFRHQAAWGTQLAIRSELHLGPTVVATDLSWLVSSSSITSADLMDGQRTDLRLDGHEIGTALPGPTDVPPVTWSPAPPVRTIEELAPISTTRIGPDTWIVDFGQNASGRVRLRGLGTEGTRTVLDFGEHLDASGDLTLDHLNLDAPDGSVMIFRQRDEVISNGDPTAVFEPHHTVHGFQYVRVERAGGLDLSPSDITMQVLHSDLRPAGSFACSDADLNRLYNVADWSFRGNAVDIPTDCPTRERAGWTGDWQIFVPTAVRLYDVDGFSRKWLQSVRDDQLDDGRIVNISPDNARLRTNADPMLDMATGSAGWGDAVVLVPWELYRTYGDRLVLEENWTAMVRWVEFALHAAAAHRHPSRVERSIEPLPHERFIWDGTFHFGEWCEPVPLSADGTPGPAIPDPMAWAMSDKGEVGTAYLYRSVSTLARIAQVLGKFSDADRLTETAEHIRDAWRTEFLDCSGRTSVDTQPSYVRALSFDLVPESLRSQTAQHLVAEIEAAGMHLTTGFLSTADLLPVLADHGYADVAHELLHQRTTPSWLGMIDRGATTIWEEWEGVDRNGSAHASLNHYSKGAVIRYLQTHTLGLRQAPNSVAWERFELEPTPTPNVTWARGHFDSPQGLIEVSWSVDGTNLIAAVTVPSGATGVLSWSGNRLDLQPGRHHITL